MRACEAFGSKVSVDDSSRAWWEVYVTPSSLAYIYVIK